MEAPLELRVRQLTNTIIVNATLLFDILWSMNGIKLYIGINIVGIQTWFLFALLVNTYSSIYQFQKGTALFCRKKNFLFEVGGIDHRN